MSTERPIRDILAEMMRRERLGLIRPLWQEWTHFADDECEHVRRRADHLIRLLEGEGVRLVRAGDGEHVPAPTSPIIYQYGMVGRQVTRIIRKGREDLWDVVAVEDASGKETVEQSFTVEQALLNGGLVLTGHPDARTIPGLGTQLAALNEIYRVNAVALEPVR